MQVFAVLLAVASVAAGSALRPSETTLVETVDGLQNAPGKPIVHDLDQVIAALEATNNGALLDLIAAELAAQAPAEEASPVILPLPVDELNPVFLPLLPVEESSPVILPLPISPPSSVILPLPINTGEVAPVDRPIPVQGVQVAEAPVATSEDVQVSSASSPLVQIILNIAQDSESSAPAVEEPVAESEGPSGVVPLPINISPISPPISSNVGELATNPINAPVAIFPSNSLIQGLPLEL